MLLPPRYYVNKVRTILVSLVDAHDQKYRERMWPEVSDAGDGMNVQLTIGGRRPLTFTESLLYRVVEGMNTDRLRNKLQEWIDEARASGSREQQRRSDGALPPPKPRPSKRVSLKLVP